MKNALLIFVLIACYGCFKLGQNDGYDEGISSAELKLSFCNQNDVTIRKLRAEVIELEKQAKTFEYLALSEAERDISVLCESFAEDYAYEWCEMQNADEYFKQEQRPRSWE